MYNFKAIERKWQKKWREKDIFSVKEDKEKKFYVLEMLPYPSSYGLHIGHARNYVIGDVYARLKRMNNFNVLYPMGYDSFGLPAENAAIKENIHPKKYTEVAIKNFMIQQTQLGLSYDWNRLIASHKKEYYKWDQWIFLEFFKRGLAYRKKATVNFCSKCNTVLANEQVVNGKCWRHSDVDVEVKQLEQWFFRITNYCDDLLKDLDKIDWPENIKDMQRNWIGKSYGTEIIFEIPNLGKWPIFTTRPDTIYGVTFMVVSAQHLRLMELVTEKQKKDVEKFLKKLKSTSEKDIIDLEKEGVFTGSYAQHPLTKEKIPIWAGNFVLADYGSGMVMAVPAHDQRDYDFAKKYKIPIKKVIEEETKVITIKESLKPEFYKQAEKLGRLIEKDGLAYIYTEKVNEIFELARTNFVQGFWYAHSEGKIKKILLYSKKDYRIYDWGDEKELKQAKSFGLALGIMKEQLDFDEVREAYEGSGTLVNSGDFNGLFSEEAKEHITRALELNKLGGKVINYKLRDWLISRQRYWGTPIPMIYCENCGIVPVLEKDLPVLLPDKVKFGIGNPLETNKKFVDVKCSKCKGKGRRETDTMDTFFDSSWYYLRYTDSNNKKKPFDPKKANYWMPVDFYAGGAEHAVLHLIYARFFFKALRDLGYVSYDEPFKRLFNQGMIHGEDGHVMAKSRGNVIDPLVVSERYGADALRLFLVSVSSPDKNSLWSSTGIESMSKIVKKLYGVIKKVKIGNSSKKFESKLNSVIRKVTEGMEYIRYNISIINLRELIGTLEQESEINKDDLEKIIKLFSPFTPHVAEEFWEKIGKKGFVSLAEWPKADESKIDDRFEKSEKEIERTISDIVNIIKIVREKQGKEIERIYLYAIPNEIENYNVVELTKRMGKEVNIFAVNDKNKYDPEGKSSKAKPGKPGIYVE